MTHENIHYDVTDRVATITIDRPEKRNAMTFAMNAEYARLIREASDDDAVQILVVTGAKGEFCAGFDMADLEARPLNERGLKDGKPKEGADAKPRRAKDLSWWPLANCPKPTICAVDGTAVGMGAEYTSQADFRIVTPRARFGWIFAQRGLVSDTGAGTWLLPRLIGLPRAIDLLYTGRFLDAEEAKEIGFAQVLVESERLEEATREVADRILRGSPFAHRLTKRLLYDGLSRDALEHLPANTDALRACFQSDDHKEGVRAFLEKRPPRFTGN